MLTRRVLSMAVGCALFTASSAWAQQVLWDSPPNPDLPAFVDQDFGDFPDFSTYLVAHVLFEGPTFIYDITTYYTNANNLWPQGNIDAVVNIFNQDGSLPGGGDDPPLAQVTANMAAGPNGFELTASLGGVLHLDAGEYWIGLTPILDFGRFGQEFHQGTDVWLNNSAGRNPGGGFGVGTDWFDAGQTFAGLDWGMAITITGIVPTPGALALLGVAGLLGTRRRRLQ